MQTQGSSDYFTCGIGGESTASYLSQSQMQSTIHLTKDKSHSLQGHYSNDHDAPPWASKLIFDVKAIKKSVRKLQRTVNNTKKNAGEIITQRRLSYKFNIPHSMTCAVYYLAVRHGYIRVGNTRIEMQQKAYMSILEHCHNVQDLAAGLLSTLFTKDEMSTSNITGISKTGKQLQRLDRERLIAIYRQIDLQYPKQRNTLKGRSQIYEAINKKCRQFRLGTS